MSVWYQYDIRVVGNKKAIAKFLHTNEDDVRIEDFKISFGQKNGPGINISEMMISNPDLIFIINESTDYDQTCWIEKLDTESSQSKAVLVYSQTYGEGPGTYNTRLLKEYAEAFPHLMEGHKKGRPYEWNWFLSNYDRSLDILNHQKEYEEMYDERAVVDFEMENAAPWEPND